MRDFRDAKAMAQTLRQTLSTKALAISHSESLEMVSKLFGFDNWNILAAKIEAERANTTLPMPAKADVKPADPLGTLYCSFCGKSQHEIKKLIAGPTVFICNECVSLCDAILEQENDVDLLLIAEQGGRSLADLLAEKSIDELQALQGTTSSTSQQCARTAGVIRAILSGSSAQDSPSSAENRALESILRMRPAAVLKTQLDDVTKRKVNAERILDEIKTAIASRGG